MLYLFKVRKLGAFLAHWWQCARMGQVHFLTSFHEENKHKKREIAFLSYSMPDLCIVLDVTTKVTQKMAELCTEYPSLTIIARIKWKEGKKWIDFAISHCLLGKWNTEMTSQSKLDSFACIVIHATKKRPTSLFWKGTTSEPKNPDQKLFRHSKQGSS